MTHETARENIDLFLEAMHWTEKDLFHLRMDDPRMFLPGHEYVQARIYDRETRTEELDRMELMDVWGDMRFYEK